MKELHHSKQKAFSLSSVTCV